MAEHIGPVGELEYILWSAMEPGLETEIPLDLNDTEDAKKFMALVRLVANGLSREVSVEYQCLGDSVPGGVPRSLPDREATKNHHQTCSSKAQYRFVGGWKDFS